tara:strand:+ start:162 stop:1799 length:1638 start_codon:yes stop_codon:yes gene_type:complete
MFKNLSLLKFNRLRKKMTSPSKKKALDFLGSGENPSAVTGAQVAKRSPKIDKDPLISTLDSKNKTTAIEILDFFGSKRTETRLRGSVKRLRNSLINTFDIAAILKTVIIGITKQLSDAPSKLKGKGGGLLGMLKNGIIGLIGGLGAKILGILGGIISIIPGFAGFLMPALVLGGITFAVTNEDFRNKVRDMLPGSSTDDAVDEQIEQQGGAATAEALRQEQQEKRESRNPFQNFLFGTIMGEDAEYDRQIRRAEEAESIGDDGSTTSTAGQTRSNTSLLRGSTANLRGGGGGNATEQAKDLIRDKEGFEEMPYWDVNAYRAGYGSDTYTTESGEVKRVQKGVPITRADAERDIERRVTKEFMPAARRGVGEDVWNKLSPTAKAALTSIAYNYGSLPRSLQEAARSSGGDVEVIARAVEGLKSDNGGINAGRRQREADLIRSAPMRVRAITQPEPEKETPEVSANPESTSREVAQQEDDMSPEIALLPLGGLGAQPQPQPQPTGGGQVMNASLPSGGSPSIRFLSASNLDNYDTFGSRMTYGILDS